MGRMDPVPPVQQGRRVNPAESQPAVNIFESDGDVGRMCRDVGGNALPSDDAILTAEVVVVGG